ncbi:MAG: hypothetical protein HY391_02295 [Deltaproteobacteria bacterium]|nr:hypothetical protein [Deltaproteobacteria bacterium]
MEYDVTEGIAFVLPRSRKYFGRSVNPHSREHWKTLVEEMAGIESAGDTATQNTLELKIKELERLQKELLDMIDTLDTFLDGSQE